MENLKEIAIISEARSPADSFGRSLKDISTTDMGAMVVREVVKRAGIEPSDVDEAIVGQVGQITECGFVIRAVSLKAELPETTCAYPANHQCGLGPQAIADTVVEIQTGFVDAVAAVGAENISQLPYYVKDARWGAGMGRKASGDGVIDILTQPLGSYHNGVTTENVAEKYNVTRQEQDQCVLESYLGATTAIEVGKSKDKILPMELKDRKGNTTVSDTDEDLRTNQTIEKLERSKPCFVKGGTATAGNSSSLNDGAATVVVMSREKADTLGVRPFLITKGRTAAGNNGTVMGYAPKLSSGKLITKLGLDLRAIDMFEIDEVFASQALTVRRDLGLDPGKADIYGGGISIGHPIGATGAILAVKVLYELQWTDREDAMASMCIGDR